jgi:hypothetical protein
MVKNGSLFFLDAGKGAFAVTASHVVTECLNDTKSPMFVQCMIGGHGKVAHAFNLGDRIIDAHRDIDIATLRFRPAEVEALGRTVLTGVQKMWPPRLAEVDGGVTYCGFPGNGRRWLAPRQISFGCVPMAGIATSTRETSISIQIEREKMEAEQAEAGAAEEKPTEMVTLKPNIHGVGVDLKEVGRRIRRRFKKP